MRPPERMNSRTLPVEVDDPEVQKLNVIALHFERNLLEAAFASSDANEVVVDAETYRLLAKQLPILALVHLLGIDVQYAATVKIMARTRRDLEALDRPSAALQIDRPGALAGIEALAQIDLLHLVVAEHDRHPQDEDRALRRLDADGGEAALMPLDSDDVAIYADAADARRAQQHPITVAARPISIPVALVRVARQTGVTRSAAVPVASPLRCGRAHAGRHQQQSCKRSQDVSAQHSFLPN